MKKIILLFLFISIKGISQEITGKWKVTSYEDEIVYYDKSKDSLLYKDPSRKDEAESFRKMYEILILPITYEFRENNDFEMVLPNIIQIKGKYEVIDNEKYILLTDENGKTDTLPFSKNKEALYIKTELENGFVRVGLERLF
ncbi:hypothetical protein ML462_06280 [Gramella lutea]|uniref:Lipocalin-like domain-containing protein n=1 Tax=Christiangramia lutea TaxID=1607951 RepID=A0A9X2A8P8_9FLAO|nr:hypothetical protein [Christiangramia lutea]MCH4822774.1 hypothetical protein [Christiangramia lutea]